MCLVFIGELCITYYKQTNIPNHPDQDSTFLDHVRGGLRINLAVCVDLTSSATALHRPEIRTQENPYTTAIRVVGEILADYDYDKKILGLGFGSTFGEGEIVRHCFPLCDNEPYCTGVEGVLAGYRETLDNATLAEPTRYSDVLQFVSEDAKRAGDAVEYSVILIITDGGVTDLEETKETLVRLSKQPISVVFLGVGDGDMSALQALDGDKARISSKGEQADRDIVQFVHLNTFLTSGLVNPADFDGSTDAAEARLGIAKAVLAEIPRQVVEYTRRAGILPRVPEVPVEHELEDFDKRFNL